jgi:hypothetical protein
LHRRAGVGEEGGDLVLVLVEHLDDRVQMRKVGAAASHRAAETGQQRREVVAEQPPEGGEARVGDVDRPPQPLEEGLQVRGGFSGRDQGGAELAGGRLELLHHRVGDAREAVQALQGGPRLALEGGEDPEEVGEVLVAAGGGREHGGRVADQAAELPLALGEGLEDVAAAPKQLADREALAVEDAEKPVGLLRERVELGDRRGQVRPLAVQRGGRSLHPHLERVASARVEGAEDLVELDRIRDLSLGQGAALGQAGPLLVPRRQLDEGLAEQGLLAQDIRTSDCSASWVASLNGTVNR